MRVIAGRCRGRKLISPKGRDVRPTADRVKEAIFDMAQALVPGSRVLDLYAGTGALGIEALSRGAVRALFVESNPRNARTIAANLERCGLQDEGTVITGEAIRTLLSLAPEPKWDLVLADPPYAAADDTELLKALADCIGLADNAMVYLERSAAYAINDPPGGLVLSGDKRYGDTSIVIYSKQGEGV